MSEVACIEIDSVIGPPPSEAECWTEFTVTPFMLMVGDATKVVEFTKYSVAMKGAVD